MANVDVVKAVYESFGKGDIEAVMGAMDPNIAWREAEGNPYKMDGQPWVGPQAILENLFMKLGSEWEGFTVTPKSFMEAGDRVIVEARYTGKYLSTGKSLNAQVCHIWDVAGGKLTAFQQYTDTAQLQDVTGKR